MTRMLCEGHHTLDNDTRDNDIILVGRTALPLPLLVLPMALYSYKAYAQTIA
jgi:hypothetical protein